MTGRQPRKAAQVALEAIWDEDDGSSDNDGGDCIVHIADVQQELQSEVEDDEEESNSEDDDVPVRHNQQPVTQRHQELQDHNSLLIDKNGHSWSEVPPIQRRRGAADILACKGGPTPASKKTSILETWQLFFTDKLLEDILAHSVRKLHLMHLDKPPLLTISSLKAYIGVLYFRGANADTQISVGELWSEQYTTFYRSAMSRNLFNLWTSVLRFDNVSEREEKLKTDTFAAIRDLWMEWNLKLQENFIPTECIVIDEQLVASRTRSPHRIYNPSKPGKYGELIHWSCDGNFRYFIKGHPQTKRPCDQNAAALHVAENKAKALVLDLSSNALDGGRNIVADRFFTSIDLAKDLLGRKTTYTGTLMKNKRDIPPLLHKEMSKYQSQFVFGSMEKKVTLQSYQVKPKKVIHMLSTMHHDKKTNADEKKKSEIQLYYNSMKSGVDVCDKMAKTYTVRTQSRRWPMVHFHNMLDVTGINSFTIFNYHHPNWSTVPVLKRRRIFLHKLAHELILEHVKSRLLSPDGLSVSTVEIMENISGQQSASPNPPTEIKNRLRCQTCRLGKLARNCNLTSFRYVVMLKMNNNFIKLNIQSY